MIALLASALLAMAPAHGASPRADVARGSSLRPITARADTVMDTVFVVSNRRRLAPGFTRDVTDSLWYGVYVTRLVMRASNAPRPQVTKLLQAFTCPRVTALLPMTASA